MSSQVDRRFYALNAVLSGGALAFLGYLLLGRADVDGGDALRFLPTVNATLNALAAGLLVAGFFAIRARRRTLHRNLMLSAFVASSLFLVSYVTYHFVHGDTKFTGVGSLRVVYFSVLISHVLLSMSVVPLALSALYFALTERFGAHKRVTRWLLPIWLYVSVSGVVIYFMLRG